MSDAMVGGNVCVSFLSVMVTLGAMAGPAVVFVSGELSTVVGTMVGAAEIVAMERQQWRRTPDVALNIQ